jgi:hypothetical protein
VRLSVLTPDDVHNIRTAGLTDAYWERVLGVSRTAVNKARLGATWQTHPTPPDTKQRASIRNAEGLPQMSVSERTVSQLLARWPSIPW